MGRPGARPLTRVGVDTCVLLALADHESKAWGAVKSLRHKLGSVVFLVMPTVLAELIHHMESKHSERARLARCVFEQIGKTAAWKDFRPADLVPVGHGIVEQIAKKLHRQGFLPTEEWNDALIIGESALHECRYLLTEDHHMLDIRPLDLNALIKDFTLDSLTVLSCTKASA